MASSGEDLELGDAILVAQPRNEFLSLAFHSFPFLVGYLRELAQANPHLSRRVHFWPVSPSFLHSQRRPRAFAQQIWTLAFNVSLAVGRFSSDMIGDAGSAMIPATANGIERVLRLSHAPKASMTGRLFDVLLRIPHNPITSLFPLMIPLIFEGKPMFQGQKLLGRQMENKQCLTVGKALHEDGRPLE